MGFAPIPMGIIINLVGVGTNPKEFIITPTGVASVPMGNRTLPD
jgi:hypothetical protein